jgi:polyhydroxybutyrate depolymerase
VKRLLGLVVIALLFAACSNRSDAVAPSNPTTVPKATTTTAPHCTEASDTTLQRVDLDAGGTPRYALVHVPKGWDGTSPLPLVLSFHGLGASAENQMSTDNFATLADRKQFIVAYPAATGGGSFGAAWNFKDPDTELAFVDQLLSQLESRLCVDATRVYATGLSYGGAMTDLLSCERADVFAATAPVSAYLPPRTCDSKITMPTVSFHGTDDQLLPYAGGGISQQVPFEKWGATTAARNGCRPRPTESHYRATVEALTWHGCKEPVVLHRVHHNGHTWPGHPLGLDRSALVDFFSGKTTGQPYPLMTLLGLTPEQFADTISLANEDIDASAMIWDFFTHHTLTERARTERARGDS